MRQSSALLIFFAFLLPTGAVANTIVNYTLTSLGGSSYRYNYQFSGLTLAANSELDIQFDAGKYGALSNGVAPGQFTLNLFQPNQPTGANGDYVLFTAAANPITTGTFSVNFIWLASGLPAQQQFFIYDDSVAPLRLVEQGSTTAAPVTATPEPSGLWLSCSAFLISIAGFSARRRWRAMLFQ